jgi:RNA polymerase sigma-70 factor (ECF subfamily)
MIQQGVFRENLPLSGARASAVEEPSLTMMDESSFRQFYAQTARPLWRYIHRVSGSPTLADDILQESYFRYLRTPLPVMGESQMRAYLFKIATRLIQDHWRSSKREAHWTAEEPAPDQVGPDPNQGQSTRWEMQRAFQSLKPQERSLLWLAYVEGAEHREIAETLGLKEKSIRVLLFRARKRVAALLGRHRAI